MIIINSESYRGMTRNLETADRIAKLTLALMTVVLYILRMIQGPFAEALVILSISVIAIYLLKILTHNSED